MSRVSQEIHERSKEIWNIQTINVNRHFNERKNGDVHCYKCLGNFLQNFYIESFDSNAKLLAIFEY